MEARSIPLSSDHIYVERTFLFANISQDLDQSIGLAGIGSVGNCNREVLRRIQYLGDRSSSN